MRPVGTLALAARSLRLDSRSILIHGLRGGLALMLLIALFGVYQTRTSFGAPGLNLYSAVITIDFVFVSVLAVALFATAITEERAEGSLGLMRMAGLSPLGVLAGKSISQLLVALSLLMVQLPFSMFSVTLGGVSPHQVWSGFTLLGCYLLFCYGVGLLLSTCCRTGLVASRSTLAVLAAVGLWPFAVAGVSQLLGAKYSPDALKQFTAWGALRATTETSFGGAMFGPAAWIHLGGAVVCFLLAWLLFDTLENRAVREPGNRRLLGFDHWGGDRRVPRFSGNAMMWKDYRLFVGGRRGVILRVLVYGAGAVLLALLDNPFGASFQRNRFGVHLLMLAGAGVVLDLGSLAGRVFRDEIAWQTYSSLLLLPKSVMQISYGKVMGCMSAVVAALPFVVIGVLCAGGQILVLFGPILLVYAAVLHLLLPLIAYASLWLPRGAFPLTLFGFVTVIGSLFMLVAQLGPASCVFWLALLLVSVIAAPKLHRRILERLRELSGCDVG
ncbi:MAG: ABC transporter permease subunit [Planctomycetes bacterium]|nr:ABC transporter permease subunit [Planctomycetota bacterium]